MEGAIRTQVRAGDNGDSEGLDVSRRVCGGLDLEGDVDTLGRVFPGEFTRARRACIGARQGDVNLGFSRLEPEPWKGEVRAGRQLHPEQITVELTCLVEGARYDEDMIDALDL